jgi:hypothetical protein
MPYAKPLILSALLACAPALSSAEMFPFVMPWDDASPTIVDLSGWNEKPAGRDGFVTVKDGHLYAGGKRLKIFGVNLCFGANFPDKEAAPKVAARMAKLGVNCVRFHHMDMQTTPGGIFAKDGKTLDPERLDRLDFLIAKLKEHGIYADLNLHVSRTHPDRPKAEKAGNSDFDKGVDNFSSEMIRLQKEYARMLLSHVNPYTKNAYAQEPAVAIVEINNENALFFEWQGGRLDTIAAPYREELTALWMQTLERTYGSDDEVRAAWAERTRPAGPNILTNGDFAKGGDQWIAEQHDGTTAKATYTDGAVQIVTGGAAKQAWHAQFSQAGLRVEANETYAIRFRAKAAAPERITASLSQAHEPWTVFGSGSVDLGTEWREYRVDVRVGAADTNARVVFTSLARAAGGTFWFDDVRVGIADIDGSLTRDAAGKVPAFTKSEYARRSPNAKRDWIGFLWSLEEGYWGGMRRFLRDELGVKSLVVGTQLGWSPFLIQQEMDVIDSHAYWQHPHFPGRSWDMNNWTVKNIPMAGAKDGGTLPGLALQRVDGKPYICTEYNHSAPNSYAAETFPLICAYAALQDWDGVFAFAYSHRGDDWDKQFFGSFFDIDQHPVKLATLPGALALFRRGDVGVAKSASIAQIEPNQGMVQVGKSGARLGADLFGVKRMEAFLHRVGVRRGDGEKFEAQPAPAGPQYVSDTGELTWDTEQKCVTINAPRSKAFVGEGKGRAVKLGEIELKIDSDWACVQATVLEGDGLAAARRILITATAAAENTGMKWTDAEKSSVGKNWGTAPSVVEGVEGAVKLPAGKRWKAWALDERGARREAIAMQEGALRIGPEHKTLWYELAAE